MKALTMTLVALYLVTIALASGYIVGAARHAPQRPVENVLPFCTRWGFMNPTPHTPGESLKCRHTELQMKREDI